MLKDKTDFEEKPLYRIYTNKAKPVEIGMIYWYKPWKQYCFTCRPGQPESVYNNECLKDVLDFIDKVIPELQK